MRRRGIWLALLVLPPRGGAGAQSLPRWLQWGADQRTRYESVDRRYPEGPDGGDEQLALRTRVRLGLRSDRFHWMGEYWDARTALTGSDSFVTRSHVGRHRVAQLHAGMEFGSATKVTIEAGRFARDFGMRRLIARSVYRNTGNAYDGAMATIEAGAWSLRTFGLRPLVYLLDGSRLDPSYHSTRLAGTYFTSTKAPARRFDVYAMRLDDGLRAGPLLRRRHWTLGGRMYGDVGPFLYESESAIQLGDVGPASQTALLLHLQAGRRWPHHRMEPRIQLFHDYASRSFDTLYGARRFELGPTGIWGLLARGNLNSPGYAATLVPRRNWEASFTHRAVWLAAARGVWGATGLADATGRAGTRAGQQAELRVRYRWSTLMDFDAGLVHFADGPFVLAVRPDSRGRRSGNYLYAGIEWRLGKL